MKRARTLEERLWRDITKDGPTVDPELGPCWDWIGTVDTYGYGRIRVRRNSEPAFKILYEIVKNEKIEPEKELRHLCDRKICVNPDHLVQVTPFDISSLRRPRHKLHEELVKEIREKFENGVSKSQLGRDYDVSFMTITSIVRRETWTWVE